MPTVATDFIDNAPSSSSFSATGRSIFNMVTAAGVSSPANHTNNVDFMMIDQPAQSTMMTMVDNPSRMVNHGLGNDVIDVQQQQQQQYLQSHNNMELVTNYVDAYLQADSIFPQLTDLLKISPGFVTISGRRDVDYPNLEEYGNSLKTLSQFVGLKTIPLPKVLIEKLGEMMIRCELGIFPEIGQAWLTMDTTLYLWKYDTGTDVAYYDELTQVIIKVELCKVKPGMLKSHIKYILVLATYLEIILLGVTFSDYDNPENMGSLLLLPEPLCTLPTDNVEVRSIKSTDDGRIFFGGNDGCLYEIDYQSSNGWFGNRFRKINHSISVLSFLVPKMFKNSKPQSIVQIEIDNTRNILYTLNEDGDIDVYDLGQDGKSTTNIFQKTSSSITKEAIAVASAIDESNFKTIVTVNSIEECESIYMNLVAITKTGVRLYFTTKPLNSPEQRPNCLQLLHIRLPPGFAASSISHRPNSVQMTHYKKGNFIFVSNQNDGKDTIWALSSESFAFKRELSELYTIIPMKFRIWAMAEEKNVIDFKPYQSLFFKNKTFPLETPAIVTQHIETAKKFVFITTQGVIIGYKPRLVDQLKELLLENQGYDNDAVKSFFHLHSSSFQSNPCVFALIIACDSHPSDHMKLIHWATGAFFHYGSEIYDNVNNQISNYASPVASPMPPTYFSTPISSPYPMTPSGDMARDNSFKMSPISGHQTPEQQSSPMKVQYPQMSNFPLVNFSSKCRGLFIYFSRIIRPIWNLKTVNVSHSQTTDGPKEYLTSNISVDEIKIYLQRLMSLYNFLKNNMKFSSVDSDKYLNSPSMNEQQVNERTVIFGLFKLIENCMEVLNLWKLLCIHQFHVIVANVPDDKKTQLSNMNFKELTVYGSEMTTLLASALVRRFLEDTSTTDIINKRLQEVCPSIYKNENALHAKVHEMILKSKSITNENDRKILLELALKRCKSIGPRINLQAICDLFQSVHWYEAIVDICLTTSKNRDPQGLALHYYKNKDKIDGNDDQQGKNIYESRIECYKILLDVYGRLVQQSKTLLSPRTAVSVQDYPSPEDAKTYSQTMMRLATQSNDELLHYTLYNWLYEHNQMDELLEIKSPYLEAYLKEKTSEIKDSIALMDFLWLYYERNGHFSAAAQILAKLADQNSMKISLYKRIEYLSRAIVCMKSLDAPMNAQVFSGVAGSAGEFLHIIEEKLDVARIQLQLLNSIEKIKPVNYEIAIQDLNSRLMNVTELYQKYAEPFDLFECQLKILHCAGHDDISLIENIWRKIIEVELQSVRLQDTQTQIKLLKNKVHELGISYLNTEKFFPLELIILELQFSSHINYQTVEPYWLVETFVELRIPLIDLFEIYHKIYKSTVNHRSQRATLDLISLLEILIYLMNQLDRCTTNLIDRKYFATKALDLISGYISDLLFYSSTLDTTDSKVKEIHSELNKTKQFLERIS